MIIKSDSITKISAALGKAQSQMGKAITESVNPHFKSKYADLSQVLDTVLPPLNANGIALTQLPGSRDGLVTVTTMLLHESGEFIGMEAAMAPAKPGPHAYGSCITYLRRYSAAAVCGLTQADDDGNQGQGKAAVDTSGAEQTLRAAAMKSYDDFTAAWGALDGGVRTAISEGNPQLIAELKALCQEAA
jgi:hypothetical protein